LANCDDIAPLLSAFNDGELEPLEADQVSLHLNNCEGCRDTLLDFVLIGHHVRNAVPMPSLEGFAQGVLGAIAATGRRPIRDRLLYRLEELRERWVAVVSLAGAAIAMASLILVLAEAGTLVRISSWIHPGSKPIEVAQKVPAQAAGGANPATSVSEPFDSQTFISRLEARHPSVATWSEPENKTTVIWLGDDASGND
jgi:anti-sigma factor RsiW